VTRVSRAAPVVCTLLVLGCGGDAGAPPADARTDAPLAVPDTARAHEPDAAEPVALALAARREGDVVIVAGTTDLPDGALISFELRHERFGALPGATGFEDGATTVRSGRFSERVGIDGWPGGAIDVWAAFEPTSVHGAQPAPVLERYGRSGERLAGDNVARRGASRFAETRQTIR
jgi:hypothetical protein